jgi:hypothetical protein
MTNPESTRNTPQSSDAYWSKVNEKRKNSKGDKNRSSRILVRYESGMVYAKDKQTGGGLWGSVTKFLRKGVNLLANWNTFGNAGDFGLTDNSKYISGFQINNKWIDGVAFSEYYAYDKIRLGSPPKGCDVVGCYIYPYFKGHQHMKGKDTQSTGKNCPHCTSEKNEFQVDTHGLPHHFLYNHAYYSFEVFGEQYAKMHGIEKMSKKDIFGFNFDVRFSSYVSWNFDCYIHYGVNLERLSYQCTFKEDIKPDDGRFAKWLATAVGSLALAYASGGASLAATAATGAKNVEETEETARAAQEEKVAKGRYKDGNPWVWGKKDEAVVDEAVDKEQKKADRALNADKKKQSAALRSNVGNSYNKMAKTVFGGTGTYSSSIQEFISSKAKYPMLYLRACASYHYQNTWLAQMNKRIATWDFYFGHDAEIALREGFGMVSGTGWDKEKYKKATDEKTKKQYSVLNDLHGFIQLQDTIAFTGMFNPFVDDWIGSDIFVYQLRNSKRPRLTKESFFEGFTGTISYGLHQQGSTDSSTIKSQQTRVTETNDPKSEGYSFVYAWCSTGVGGGGGNFVVSDTSSTVGSGKRITQYEMGSPERTVSSFPSGVSVDAGYKRVSFGGARKGQEMTFGAGSKYVVLKYMKSDPDEEQVVETSNPGATTWVFRKVGSGTKEVQLIARVLNVEQVISTIEMDTPGLTMEFNTSIGGMSGMEAWGNNPPDGFGGGGISQGASLDAPDISQQAPGMGISLPTTNALGIDTSMPQQMAATINPDVNISSETFEMPKASGLEGLNAEYASGAYTSSGTQDTSTDRGGETSGQRGDDDERTRDN